MWQLGIWPEQILYGIIQFCPAVYHRAGAITCYCPQLCTFLLLMMQHHKLHTHSQPSISADYITTTTCILERSHRGMHGSIRARNQLNHAIFGFMGFIVHSCDNQTESSRSNLVIVLMHCKSHATLAAIL